MNFSLVDIAVPFRMQPGLRRLEPADPQLTRLDPAGELYREKRAVMEIGQSRHVVAGFDPSAALDAIRARMPSELPPEIAYEQDFAVLDGESGALKWLCVCVPSHWAPEEKIGLDFPAVHAPVADNKLLVSSASQLVKLATSGDCWERFVWTVTPSGRYDQHPKRHLREPWPQVEDARQFAQKLWLRAERQTFFPVAGTRQSVFTIRVMLQPLVEAVEAPGAARKLHDALATMSDAVLAYKGLAPARDRLLAWLSHGAA
ncbi:MAG TPA: heme-dependent oxidative N-demethylase subunit alpha family protein [Ramlibacter sp.]|nr:heme-dependent oxidative N-demethylase subunit alpha family protein [Ramlibacter sp.]